MKEKILRQASDGYDPFVAVDLGCGKDKVKGAIGIDINMDSDADIIADIITDPIIPLESSSVDRVTAKQFFEHIENPFPVLKEISRILKDGGELFIEVPHYTNYVAHGTDHKQYFSLHEAMRMLKSGMNAEILKAEITFYKTFRMVGIKYLANKFPENYERFWAYLFPAENIKITARVRKSQPHRTQA